MSTNGQNQTQKTKQTVFLGQLNAKQMLSEVIYDTSSHSLNKPAL